MRFTSVHILPLDLKHPSSIIFDKTFASTDPSQEFKTSYRSSMNSLYENSCCHAQQQQQQQQQQQRVSSTPPVVSLDISTPEELCNYGAVCIHSDLYGEALAIFYKAIKAVRSKLNPHPLVDTSVSIPNDCFFTSSPFQPSSSFIKSNGEDFGEFPSNEEGINISDEDITMTWMALLRGNPNMLKDASKDATIYRDPIHFSGVIPGFVNSSTTALHNEILTYCIVYNMALAFHLLAINKMNIHDDNTNSHDSNSGLSDMRNAEQLYECAHRILINHGSIVKIENLNRGFDEENVFIVSCEPQMHLMAIVYNLAHVHMCLGNVEKSHRCYERVLSLILLNRLVMQETQVREQRLHHTTESSMFPSAEDVFSESSKQFQRFIHHVISLFLVSKTIAPAA